MIRSGSNMRWMYGWAADLLLVPRLLRYCRFCRSTTTYSCTSSVGCARLRRIDWARSTPSGRDPHQCGEGLRRRPLDVVEEVPAENPVDAPLF